MGSFNDKESAEQLIRDEGHYMDDPQAICISQYTNASGGTTYHVAYSQGEIASLFASPFCSDIKVLWVRRDLIMAMVETVDLEDK